MHKSMLISTLVLVMLLSVGLVHAAPGDNQLALADNEYKISTDFNPSAHSYRPQVAYNSKHNEYLVVWHSTWDTGSRYIYARRLDQDGKPIAPPFALSTMMVNQVHPNVVYNAADDEYLVAWMYDVSGNNTRFEIWGSIIPWNASGPGTLFTIGNEGIPHSSWYPSLAWNSVRNEYLAIWDGNIAGEWPSWPSNGIGYRRIANDGTPGDTGWIAKHSSPMNSDLIYNPFNNNYFVVWECIDPGFEGIYGTRLNFDVVVIQDTIPIYTGSAHYPAIAAGSPGHYITAWQYENNGHEFVQAQRLNSNGTLYGNGFVCGGNSQVPDVAATGNSGDWLLALDTAIEWRYVNSYHLNWAYPYQMDNEENYISLYELNRITRNSAVAGGEDGFLLVYEDRTTDPGGRQHIYAYKHWIGRVFMPLVVGD